MKKVSLLCLILVLLPLTLVWSGGQKEEGPADTKGTLYYLATDMVNGFNIGSADYAEKFG